MLLAHQTVATIETHDSTADDRKPGIAYLRSRYQAAVMPNPATTGVIRRGDPRGTAVVHAAWKASA